MRKYKSKVRLVKSSFGQPFPYHGGLRPPSNSAIFICKVSIKRNGLLFKKITFKILKVILHQFWVKKIVHRKFNLEYGGTFTKLFMHVSSRNMFPTTRNLQKRVHVYRPHHCCGDWLTFGCFVPMIADHDLVKKR